MALSEVDKALGGHDSRVQGNAGYGYRFPKSALSSQDGNRRLTVRVVVHKKDLGCSAYGVKLEQRH